MKEKTDFSKLKSKLGKLAVPAFFVILVLMDLAFRFFYRSIESAAMDKTGPFLFTLCWALMLTGIAWILPWKARCFFMPAVVIFNVLVCFTHGVMHHLFGNFFAISDLYYAGDGAKFFSVTYVVIRKGFVLFAALSVAAIILLSIWHKGRENGKWLLRQLLPGIIAVAVAAGGIAAHHNSILSGLRTTMSWEENGSITDADVYKEMSDVNRTMHMCGIYQYLWRSFSVTTGLGNNIQNGETYRMLDDYFAGSEKADHHSNPMTGVLEGKNCFFVLLESIDSWMLKEEYMPNLYALQQQSLDFTEHFSTLYITASTFNTEFVANTGQIPPSSGLDTKCYQQNSFPTSLAKLFAAKGYTCKSFHSADPAIYNRGKIHVNLGYKAYHYWINMGMDNYQLDSQLIRGFDKMTAQEPFFDFLLTYSGHGPYTDELADISDPHLEAAKAAVADHCTNAHALADPEYTLAIAHAMETDQFIGELVDELESSGLADDTALVFFTDHYSKYMTDTELVKELKGAANMDMIDKTPFFVYCPAIDPQKITRVTQTPDIAPTLANLFGLDVNYAWYPGFDAFGDDAGIFGDGRGVAIFRSGAWYDGVTYSAEPAPETTAWLDKAWKVMRTDYFAH